MSTDTVSYSEIAAQLPPGSIVTFHDVPWVEYEQLLERLGEARGLRVSYTDGALSIMSRSSEHESYADFIKLLVGHLSFRQRINVRFFGSAIMKKRRETKGNEPDACFYVRTACVIGHRMDVNLSVDPPPDIVVEVDIHHDSRDTFSVYRAIGVPEIWRYDGREFSIHLLRASQYVSADNSVALPVLSARVLTDFLRRLPRDGEFETMAAFDEWLKARCD
ncbi:MAG TPA: Uma2 family endonuclease [Blastocatellia bacterium]|nr:Uma2 family endonuclease [Blastocatellia bacterium]